MPRRRVRSSLGAVRWLLAVACALMLLPWHGHGATAMGFSCNVTTAADGIPAPNGSLRQALANASCDTINFHIEGEAPWTINLVTVLQVTSRDVRIVGPGRDLLTIDGGGANQPFFFSGVGATVEGLTIANGLAVGASGGGVRITGGAVTLHNARLRDNRATGTAGGGGLYVGGGTVTLDNVEVLNNTAAADANDGGGGGIYADQTFGSTALTIRDSTIRGNAATGRGGGIFTVRWGGQASLKTMTVDIAGGSIADNSTKSGGGGIYSWQAALTVEGATIEGNIAVPTPPATTAMHGGGIRLNGGTAAIGNSTVAANSAGDRGGGLYAVSATLVVANSTITGNRATDGGGINVNDTNFAVTNSTISENTATNGGALLAYGGQATLMADTIVQNQATGAGGGILLSAVAAPSTWVWLQQSLVAGNLAGGAVSDCVATDPNAAHLASRGINVVGEGGGCPAVEDGDLSYSGELAALVVPTLADNGGPTRTHALPYGSPAIDRISPENCAVVTEQRGYARPQGFGCDSGAVEGTIALTFDIAGDGLVQFNPPAQGTSAGPFIFPMGMITEFTPVGLNGAVFIGWELDGIPLGWPNPLNLILNGDHTLKATFAAEKTFPDVPVGRADHDAIVALATRGLIRGYVNGNYGPDDVVNRAQMAALIARATPSSSLTMTPPACQVARSWDCENWGNDFVDRGGLDGNLWRDVGVLQHYGVAHGVDGTHFGPGDPVTFAQTISFITRAMEAKGIWIAQPDAPLPYAGVPAAHANDLRTFAYYVYVGGVPAPPTDWNAATTRGWFARALWAALDAPPLP